VFKRKSTSDKPAKAPKAKKEKKSRKKRVKPATKVKAASLGPVKKQPIDIYTVMLIISMAAVFVACVLLLFELNRFGSYPWWKAS
jgi:hypothetical protein